MFYFCRSSMNSFWGSLSRVKSMPRYVVLLIETFHLLERIIASNIDIYICIYIMVYVCVSRSQKSLSIKSFAWMSLSYLTVKILVNVTTSRRFFIEYMENSCPIARLFEKPSVTSSTVLSMKRNGTTAWVNCWKFWAVSSMVLQCHWSVNTCNFS